jgi:mannose-6-phosphate isomerase-like protein (cupin superfamily)
MVTDTKAKADAHFFSLRTPLLADGRSDTTLAQTDLLRLRLKVYASGGENVMHFHPHEDHSFVVLAGEATFHIGTDDAVTVLTTYNGVMIPRGVSYWFQSSATENLVMLRAGAAEKWPDDGRLGPDGKPLPGYSAANKHVEGVPLPGQFFGA